MNSEHQDPSEGPKQNKPEAIDYFSLVGFDNPERENGVEGAFLGVKSSEADRVCSQPPSDMNANDSQAEAERPQSSPSLWSIRLRYLTGDGGRNCTVEIWRRFNQYFLSFQEACGDPNRIGSEVTAPVRHEIKEAEFAELNDLLRLMSVPVIHETIDWPLDETNELTVRFTGSAFAFYWCATPKGWEALELVVAKIHQLRSQYTEV